MKNLSSYNLLIGSVGAAFLSIGSLGLAEVAQGASMTQGFEPAEAPSMSSIISNGTIQLGVNNEGHLNVSGGTPSSGTGTSVVGLRYLPTNAEFTAPGCLCEGWGVGSDALGISGYANISVDGGPVNLDLVSFSSTATTATSIVTIDDIFKVIHEYKPSDKTPLLYDVIVTIENISDSSVDDVRYRRVMDWDIEPTAFQEFVTIQGTTTASEVVFASDNGFASANPLAGPSSIAFIGDAVNNGPIDHGALFDFDFGLLASGESKSFNIFYGAASNETEALGALALVEAEVFSLGQPNVEGGPELGIPNTAIFAFKGVGGEPIIPVPSVPEPSLILGLLAMSGFSVSLKHKKQRK